MKIQEYTGEKHISVIKFSYFIGKNMRIFFYMRIRIGQKHRDYYNHIEI